MTLRKAKENEFPNLSRLYRRASLTISMEHGEQAIDRTLDEDYLLKAVQEGRVNILVDKGKILAYIVINHSLSSFFFSDTRSEEKEMNLLLQTKPKGSEPYIVIEQMMVDPFYQKKGLGRNLFFSVADQYRDGLVLSALIKENEGALAFLRSLGCLARGYIELEKHCPSKLVLISYRLHERTATYRARNNIHAS